MQPNLKLFTKDQVTILQGEIRRGEKLQQEEFPTTFGIWDSVKFITFTSKLCKYGIPLNDDFSRHYELGFAFKKTFSILQCKSQPKLGSKDIDQTLSFPIKLFLFCHVVSDQLKYSVSVPLRIVDPSKHIRLRPTCSQTDRKKAEWELL